MTLVTPHLYTLLGFAAQHIRLSMSQQIQEPLAKLAALHHITVLYDATLRMLFV